MTRFCSDTFSQNSASRLLAISVNGVAQARYTPYITEATANGQQRGSNRHSRAELNGTALYTPCILLARNERRHHANIPWSQAADAADTGFPYRIRLSWCAGTAAGAAF